ncbi:radical SAM/SPASM domain-containing protein [Ketobacter sp.]
MKSLKSDAPPASSRGLHYWDALLNQSDDQIKELLLSCNDLKKKKEIFKRNVSIINIETSSSCNRVCTYCPDSIYDRKSQILMNKDLWGRFVSNIEELQFAKQISLNLYNEPMLDPTLYKKLSQLKAASPEVKTKISTNGDYINSKTLAELEESGLDFAYITLHQPAGKPYEDNIQLNYFKRFFKRCDITDIPDIDFQPGVKIASEFSWGNIKVVLMSNNWGDFGNDRAGTVEYLKERNVRESPCMRVFRELTLSHQGKAFPCCQFFPDAPSSQQHILGDLQYDDIWSIYLNKLSIGWRKSQFAFSRKQSPCDSCKDLDNATLSSNERRRHLLGSLPVPEKPEENLSTNHRRIPIASG